MEYSYTDELDNYYVVMFDVDNISFTALVDKESKSLFSLESTKDEIDFSEYKDLSVSYEEICSDINKFFN